MASRAMASIFMASIAMARVEPWQVWPRLPGDRTHRSGPHRPATIKVPEQQHHRALLEVQQRRRTQVAQVPLVARVARLSKCK
jgi:hypothetical protein